MRKILYLFLFVIGVLFIGGCIGYLSVPTAWYQELNKPAFTPPNWLFAPVWSILYIIIGYVGWRVFIDKPNDLLQRLWLGQLLLNFAWSPLFFGLHQVFLAFIICAAMLILTLIFILKSWQSDKFSALLFIPYIIWLSLATALNGGILILN